MCRVYSCWEDGSRDGQAVKMIPLSVYEMSLLLYSVVMVILTDICTPLIRDSC